MILYVRNSNSILRSTLVLHLPRVLELPTEGFSDTPRLGTTGSLWKKLPKHIYQKCSSQWRSVLGGYSSAIMNNFRLSTTEGSGSSSMKLHRRSRRGNLC